MSYYYTSLGSVGARGVGKFPWKHNNTRADTAWFTLKFAKSHQKALSGNSTAVYPRALLQSLCMTFLEYSIQYHGALYGEFC